MAGGNRPRDTQTERYDMTRNDNTATIWKVHGIIGSWSTRAAAVKASRAARAMFRRPCSVYRVA